MTWRESTYSSSACAIDNGRRNNASTSRNAATQIPILVQQPFHQTHHLPPPGRLFTKRLYARLRNRIELRFAVVLRPPPLTCDPPILLQSHQRRIQRPLVQVQQLLTLAPAVSQSGMQVAGPIAASVRSTIVSSVPLQQLHSLAAHLHRLLPSCHAPRSSPHLSLLDCQVNRRLNPPVSSLECQVDCGCRLTGKLLCVFHSFIK